MLVSIIIPTYNRAKLLPRAIRSVLNQQYQTLELIIVDDGSTDNTAEVMKEFMGEPRVKYFQKENSGAAHSRNVGVQRSSAEWITFLDSDDEGEPDWLKKNDDRCRRSECIGCLLWSS